MTVRFFKLALACVASVSVGFRSKELPLLLSPQFRAGKIPFLGLSLLLNPTETLATRAKLAPFVEHVLKVCAMINMAFDWD